MNRGWAMLWRRFARRWFAQQRTPISSRSSLFFESLEDRNLLSGTPGHSVRTDFVVGPPSEATSLIVQFRSGASSASSLAAYITGNSLGQDWAVAPGLRQVQVNPGVNVQSALAAYSADAKIGRAHV